MQFDLTLHTAIPPSISDFIDLLPPGCNPPPAEPRGRGRAQDPDSTLGSLRALRPGEGRLIRRSSVSSVTVLTRAGLSFSIRNYGPGHYFVKRVK